MTPLACIGATTKTSSESRIVSVVKSSSLSWRGSRRAFTSMPAEHESLQRQHQRLQPQDQGVNEPERVDRMQNDAPQDAGVLGRDDVVVVGIGVGDAA